MKRLISIIILSLICNALSASNLVKVLEQSKINGSNCNVSLVKEDVVPYEDSTSVFFIPVKNSSNDRFLDALIVFFNTAKAEITCSYLDKEAINLDLMNPSSVSFDFAAFFLDEEKTIRAFGVRLQENAAHRNMKRSSEVISLYLPTGKSMEKLLDKYPMSNTYKKWNDYGCESETFSENRIMVMSRTKAKKSKYRDINVRISVTSVVKKGVDGVSQTDLDSLLADESIKLADTLSLVENEEPYVPMDSAAFAAEIAANDEAIRKSTEGLKAYGTVTAGSEIKVTQRRRKSLFARLFGKETIEVKKVEITKISDDQSYGDESGPRQVLEQKGSNKCIEMEQKDVMNETLRFVNGCYK